MAMNYRYLLFLPVLCAFATSCEKTRSDVIWEDQSFTIFAVTESTKTTNNGLTTYWESGDKATVICAPAGTTDYINQGTFTCEDAGTGKFSTSGLKTALDVDKSYDWYMIYRSNSNVKKPDGTSTYAHVIGCAATSSQTQAGNDSMSHLCKSTSSAGFPLAGNVKNVPASEYPVITVKNVASVIGYKLTNGLDKGVSVKSIVLTSTNQLVGSFKVDFSGDEPVTTASYASATATLNVTDGTAIASGSSALFYVGIAPHTEAAGNTLSVAVTVTDGAAESTQTFNLTLTNDVTFSPGKIKTFELTFNQSF